MHLPITASTRMNERLTESDHSVSGLPPRESGILDAYRGHLLVMTWQGVSLDNRRSLTWTPGAPRDHAVSDHRSARASQPV